MHSQPIPDAITRPQDKQGRERVGFRPAHILPNIAAGLIVWLIGIILATSFAALIFQGRLGQYYSLGVGMVLVSSMVISLLLALFGSDRATMAYTQSTAAAILATIVTNIVDDAPATLSDDGLFYLVVITLGLAGLLAGLFFIIMGVLHMGNLIRYIPYPVIGGFLAGSGWLLVQGAFDMMVGVRMGIDLLDSDMMVRWLPGLLLGVFCWRRCGDPITCC